MASFRSGPPAAGGPLPVKTGACASVAELIDYARGQASPDDRQRIEKHLQNGACGYCQRWIERARTVDGPAAAAPAGKWQRDAAFRDLEERLRKLED
jgi:hypothetical protein